MAKNFYISKIEAMEETVKQLQEELAAKDARIAELERRTLSDEDTKKIWEILWDRIDYFMSMSKRDAECIVEYAETPECDDFKNAVVRHRSSLRTIEEYKVLVNRVMYGKQEPETAGDSLPEPAATDEPEAPIEEPVEEIPEESPEEDPVEETPPLFSAENDDDDEYVF